MSGHIHGHHSSIETNQRRLLIALSITGFMTIVELVGGLMSNSLALLGDAGHMFTDTLALGLSLFALNLAKKPADQSRTYGYLRAEIMAALTNGAVLIVISAYIFYEAYQRFLDPPDVQGGLMLAVAVVGFAVNMFGIAVLHSASRDNLNVRSAFLHMWGDAISSIGVIAGGVIIVITGWHYADPIISVIIGFIILKGAVGLVRESSNILMEATPRHIDITEVVARLKRTEGLRDVHDVHVWTITSGVHALSAHLLIDDQMVSRSRQIVEEVNHMLSHEFDISHATLQLECTECENSPLCQPRRNTDKV